LVTLAARRAGSSLSLRAHAVSLASVFLALGLGVLAGGELLHGTVMHDLHTQVHTLQASAARSRADAEVATRARSREDTFAAAALPRLLTGALAGGSVALVTAPGTRGVDVHRLQAALTMAGAKLASVVALTSELGRSDAEQLLSDLTARLAQPGVRLPADPALAVATILAATVAPAPGTPAAAPIASTLAALQTAGVLAAGARAGAAANEVLILTGDTSDKAALRSILLLAQALSSRATPSAVSGVVTSSMTAPVAVVRGDGSAARVSTTDDLDLPQGPGVAVLALAASRAGHPGSFGGGPGASAALPPVTGS
jgi:hypothetical protein